MRISRYASFIIIATILIFLIIVWSLISVDNYLFNANIETDDSLIVQTADPLVLQQLNDNDLLPKDLPLVTFIDPQRGATDPKIDLVEFSDFACPYCQEIQAAILSLLKTYPNTIRHVWKDAPNNSLHPQALAAHLAARCAQRQNKFWEYHDELFKNTNNFSSENLKNIAKFVGLDEAKWQKCFADASESAKIERGLIEAEALGVDATPYLFINNQKVSGAITFAELQQIVVNELSSTATPTN